jgi:hypothetical protein
VYGSRGVVGEGCRVLALAIAIAAAALVSACSPGADYPAVLVPPPPRPDTTMDADQVKQATDALISQRDRLTTDAQNNAQPAPAPAASPPATTASVPAAAKKQSKPPAGATQSAAGTTQTAGADAKP